MSIDTQKLRHAAASVRVFLKPEYGREIAAAADHIDAQAAEIDGLRAELERRSAYWITHKGAVLACSSAMRDAYSDEKVRADAAEAEIVRLRYALVLAEGAMNYMGDILNGMDVVEPDDETATAPAFEAVRAALSGEGK